MYDYHAIGDNEYFQIVTKTNEIINNIKYLLITISTCRNEEVVRRRGQQWQWRRVGRRRSGGREEWNGWRRRSKCEVSDMDAQGAEDVTSC